MSESMSTTVPCSCSDRTTGGDGMEDFEVNPLRRIESLTQMVERGWYFMEVELTGPVSRVGIEPRVGHSLIPVRDKKEMYMIGGGNHLGDLPEVWRVDYAASSEPWECHIDPGLSLDFSSRYEFFCGLNKSEDKIWIFGGANVRTARNDVCYIDIQRGSLEQVTPTQEVTDSITGVTSGSVDPNAPPTPRTQGANSCLVDLDGEEYLAVFGGGIGKHKSVADGHLYLFKISDSTWSRLDVRGSMPTPVQGHSMVPINGSTIYMFGGMENMRLFDDFYSIDLTQLEPKWIKIKTGGSTPGPRAAHGVTAIGKDIYLFGGVGEHGSLSDLWKYNTERNDWTLIDGGMGHGCPSIPPRLDCAMTSLTVNLGKGGGESEILVVHGGMNIMGHLFDDYWLFPLYIPN